MKSCGAYESSLVSSHAWNPDQLPGTTYLESALRISNPTDAHCADENVESVHQKVPQEAPLRVQSGKSGRQLESCMLSTTAETS